MRIEVTEEHIKKGRRHSCLACPIALATQEAMSDPFACVGQFTLALSDGRRAKMPDEATAKVLEYDATGVMGPFAFETEFVVGKVSKHGQV